MTARRVVRAFLRVDIRTLPWVALVAYPVATLCASGTVSFGWVL